MLQRRGACTNADEYLGSHSTYSSSQLAWIQQQYQSETTRRIEWRKAFSAMRRLIDNPDATDEVFTIIEALAGNALEKGFSTLLLQLTWAAKFWPSDAHCSIPC
jgi:hypothetical protein